MSMHDCDSEPDDKLSVFMNGERMTITQINLDTQTVTIKAGDKSFVGMVLYRGLTLDAMRRIEDAGYPEETE